MSDTDASVGASDSGDVEPAIQATTTYDLLKARLRTVANQLRESSDALNASRIEAFASVALVLAEQDRVRTESACIPRDAVCIGDLLLLGTNIPPGLATQRSVGDVFSLFKTKRVADSDWDFSNVPPDDPDLFLADSSFQRDFNEIYRYYSEARLISQQLRGDELLMVFGIGTNDDDVRVLRWRMQSGKPVYLDANGEHDRVAQRRYDFAWTEASRDLIVEGRWPHFNLDDQLFVGAIRGVLEFRIEDAVAGGRTLLTEKLNETEADLAEIRTSYVRLGDLLLLRMLPYRETVERFYIFNRLTREVQRVDAMARGCHQLPEGQGVVFPGGFHLQNGETRVFATDSTGFDLIASHRSPNGEDILYVYERPDTGSEMLLSYNVVARDMATPVSCHGYALFDDGMIVCIREAVEAQRIHTISVYKSPFCTTENYQPAVASGSFFGRVGNPELVHALGETLSLAGAASNTEFNAAVFEALVARSNKLIDTYAWLNEPEAHHIGDTLVQLRKSAGSVLDEFASVASAKREATAKLAVAENSVLDFLASADLGVRDTDSYIELMAGARKQLGALSELSEVRYVEHDRVKELNAKLVTSYESLGAKAVEFLDDPASLEGLRERLRTADREAAVAPTSAAVAMLAVSVDEVGERLVLLTEVVGGLEVADVTRKTSVLTRLSAALAERNGTRANLEARNAALRSTESAAGFTAAMAVLSQRAVATLSVINDAPSCDASLAQITAELENAELAYGDVTEFADAIAVKRDELYEAFSRRREALATEKTRKIDRLADSANRVLETLKLRAASLEDRAAIDGFFATDALVAKVRRTADELRRLGEAGRAEELEVALLAARDAARRTATDRAELFDAGTVKIGKWKIGTNAEPFELRLVANREGTGFEIRLTGTELALPVNSDALKPFVDLAQQTYVSEHESLCRAEYLAFSAFREGVAPSAITAFAAQRLEEGYEPGVHDADAEKILTAALPLLSQPALRFSGSVRAVAGRWLNSLDVQTLESVRRSLAAIGALGDGKRVKHSYVHIRNRSPLSGNTPGSQLTYQRWLTLSPRSSEPE